MNRWSCFQKKSDDLPFLLPPGQSEVPAYKNERNYLLFTLENDVLKEACFCKSQPMLLWSDGTVAHLQLSGFEPLKCHKALVSINVGQLLVALGMAKGRNVRCFTRKCNNRRIFSIGTPINKAVDINIYLRVTVFAKVFHLKYTGLFKNIIFWYLLFLWLDTIKLQPSYLLK